MNLHGDIMNIPVDKNYSGHYKDGHRDARHAAAELSLASDKRIAELEAAMRSVARSKNLTEACSHACIAMGH